MYPKQVLKLMGLIQMKYFNIVHQPIRQSRVLTKYWNGSIVLPPYKSNTTRLVSTTSSTITAYKNGSEKGLFSDLQTNFSCLSSCKNTYLPHQLWFSNHQFNHRRHFCSKPQKEENNDSGSKSLSIFERFKQAYKQHGKVLVGVHVATSTVWLGCFYYLAQSGFDIIPILESLRVSESIIDSFKESALGNLASAYLMYKVATPARYTVTLAGTNLAIRYFRKTGRMEPVPESSQFHVLYKDSKTYLDIRRKQLKKRQVARMKKQFKKFNRFQKFKKRYR